MTDISVEPLGHYVLVESMEVKTMSRGGIALPKAEREQSACEFGVVKAIGPTAFLGVDGCDPEQYPTGSPQHKMTPHQIWGLNIGDRVEYRRYEGKNTGIKEAGDLRYIPDMQIIGKVSGDFEITKADF